MIAEDKGKDRYRCFSALWSDQHQGGANKQRITSNLKRRTYPPHTIHYVLLPSQCHIDLRSQQSAAATVVLYDGNIRIMRSECPAQ